MTTTLFTDVTNVKKSQCGFFCFPPLLALYQSTRSTCLLCGEGKVNTVRLEEESQEPETVAGMTRSAYGSKLLCFPYYGELMFPWGLKWLPDPCEVIQALRYKNNE